MCHSLLHDAGTFDNLRQEHLARPEEVTDNIHAIHERTLNHVERAIGREAGLFSILDHEVGNALDQGMGKTFGHRLFPPREIRTSVLALALYIVRNFEQSFRRVSTPIQHDVLYPLAQIFRNVGVNSELAGIHDSHVHSRFESVIEKHRMHGLPHRVVAAKREGHIADAAGNQGVRQLLLNGSCRLDEIDREVVVILDASRNGKDIWVKNDVPRRKSDFLGEDPVGTGQNLDHPFTGVCLARLIESHNHNRSAIAQDLFGLLDESLFAFLETDRVDHTLSLDVLEAGLDDRPFRGINHHGNP